MKKLLLILLTLPLFSYSQNLIDEVFPTEDGKIVYQEVVIIDSTLTAKDIYLNARNWMVDTFKSSKDVIQFEDNVNNVIIGRGFITKGHNAWINNPKDWFTIKIEAKDGRYRYKLYDVQYEFSITVMDVHKEFSDPIEKWGETSLASLTNPKQKEKLSNKLKEFYLGLDTEFKSLISSLKTRAIKKDQQW